MKKQLKENDPTLIKFKKLCDYASELGLALDFSGLNRTMVYDLSNNKEYELNSTERTSGCYWNGSICVSDFPPTVEYYMTDIEDNND